MCVPMPIAEESMPGVRRQRLSSEINVTPNETKKPVYASDGSVAYYEIGYNRYKGDD